MNYSAGGQGHALRRRWPAGFGYETAGGKCYDEHVARTTAHRYIVSDTQILGGEPIIAGTRTSVRAIVEMWRAGAAPEEIPRDLPHLTLAQVFDALSYYSDHTEEISAHIEANLIPDRLLKSPGK